MNSILLFSLFSGFMKNPKKAHTDAWLIEFTRVSVNGILLDCQKYFVLICSLANESKTIEATNQRIRRKSKIFIKIDEFRYGVVKAARAATMSFGKALPRGLGMQGNAFETKSPRFMKIRTPIAQSLINWGPTFLKR